MDGFSSTPADTSSPKNNLTPWLLGGAALLLVCCVASVVVIAAVTILGPVTGKVFSQVTLETPVVAVPVITSAPSDIAQPKDNALGNPNAPVRIIEYADFQCPYCANFWRDTEKQLIARYVDTGKVYFVFRSVGAFIGPESGRAAQAAYCAGDQGKFWKYHDTLFANQGPENSGAFADDKLTAFAKTLGLDVEQFGSCLRSNKYAGLVSRDQADAKEAGVTGTPSFLLDGKQLLEGAQPYDAMALAIDAILATK